MPALTSSGKQKISIKAKKGWKVVDLHYTFYNYSGKIKTKKFKNNRSVNISKKYSGFIDATLKNKKTNAITILTLCTGPTILIIKIQEQKKQKTRTPYYSKCNVEASKNAFKQFCVVTTFTVAIVWGSCFRLFILFHSLKICDTFHMNRMTKLIYDGYFL